jgi:tRNA nucleotidyltransferase/poly(A) polymerase
VTVAAQDDAVAKLSSAVPPHVLAVCAKLTEAGHEAVIVGGCVRDLILGRMPKDWDVATSANPDAVLALFKHTIATGLQHGTVTVVTGKGSHTHVEVTTYRGEGAYSDARRPDVVRFGVPLREDLQRRDLTVNAIAYEPTSRRLIDPFDGLADIEARKLRAVGSAVDRFTEDGLRVMRAVRFAAQLEFDLEPETEAGIPPALPSLAKVSRERVSDELRKLLATHQPSRGLAPALRTGIIQSILPDLAALLSDAREGSDPVRSSDTSDTISSSSDSVAADAVRSSDTSDVTENVSDTISPGATENVSDTISPRLATAATAVRKADTENVSDTISPGATKNVSDLISRGMKLVRVDEWLARIDRAPVAVRLAAMMAPIGEARRTLELLKALKFSNQEAELAAALVGVAEAEPPMALDEAAPNYREPSVRRLLSKLDKAKRPYAIDLWRAWPRVELANVAASVIDDPLDVGDLVLKGNEMMKALGMKPGPEIGRILQMLRERVLDDPRLNTREKLLIEAQRCELEVGRTDE